MAEFDVKFKFDAREVRRQVTQLLQKRAMGITTNYALHKDLLRQWVEEETGEFIPASKNGRLRSSLHFDSSSRAYVADPVDKYGRHYGQAQWTGDNGTGVPSSKWNRKFYPKGRARWSDPHTRFNAARWKKFLKEYAAPAIAEAMNQKEDK